MTHFHGARQACLLVLCMLSGSFQEHIPYDLILTYLCLPLGLMALYGGFIKNVVGQLQFFMTIMAASNQTLCLHISHHNQVGWLW